MNNKKTSDMVFEKVEEKILSGEWKSGTKITSESQLAKELNVSRVSVREAIEKMVALNLVTKQQGGGTFVNDMGPSIYLNELIPLITLNKLNYMEILEFRLILEVEGTKLCASKCDASVIDALQKCYDRMCINKDDISEFAEEDFSFHMEIAEGSKNALLIKVTEILGGILKYHQRSLYKVLGPHGGIEEHKLILDAIKNRDSELAGIYARRHIERTINEVKNK